MGAIPFAFSVHHFISSVGADAGFAAIIGLALLILLYFAQARETASLRQRADDSAEQVQQLDLRLAALARAQAASPAGAAGTTSAPVAPPPGITRTPGTPAFAGAAAAAAGAGASVAAGAGASVAAGAGAGAPIVARSVATPFPVPARAPAAPAGVGAPALSAATRLIPSSDRDQISIRAGAAGAEVQDARALRGAGAAVMAPPGPPPSTAAGGANGSGGPRMPPPVSAGAPAGSPAARNRVTRPDNPASAAPRRPAVPPARPGTRPGGRRPISRALMVAIGLLVVAAAAVALFVLTSGTGSTSPSAAGASKTTPATSSARHRTSPVRAAVSPGLVTVAVLNGTATTNLAHTVAARLAAAGYKQGTVATASDQTQTATMVGYLPHQRGAALSVAKSLSLGPGSVQPVNQNNQTVACPASSTPCPAQVVVTVGSDLASNT